MGNRLSSCGPLIRKAYRNEDTPWQNSRKRDGHLLRLWAEVFHVSTSSAGTVRWQQISEDLVPVNISCVQDQPDYVFHITAYNSQVDKILDVRLTQPGTRIGQASECFVYWKDPVTNDTWGLNFTSPADARAFRECCSPAFKFSRKASSSYSLRLESGRQKDQRLMQSNKRRTNSTPASPSHTGHAASSAVSTGGGGGAAGREPQCTCMTPEQYARLRASQDPRFRAASMTLPRTQSLKRNTSSSGSAVDASASSTTTCPTAETGGSCMKAAASSAGGEVPSSSTTDLKMGVSCANSSSSVYDNVQGGGGTLKGRTTVENYATLRHPAPTSNNSNSEPIIKDVVVSASVGDGGGMDDHLTSTAMESKSTAETQTSMATQTTQMPGQQQHEVPGALGQLPSITHRTQQQQQVVPQQPIYGQQQYPAVAAQPGQQQQQQQSMYNYYNSNPMQAMGVGGGAIPRTYAQQQQQQAMYHGMLPQQQQSQTLNRYGGYGVMAGQQQQQQQLNYGQQAHPIHHYGTLQQQPPHQSMYGRGVDPFQPHPQMQQQQQHHHPHPAYYERAYSVQGDMIGGVDGGDIRRSLSGIRGAPSHSSTGSHPHRRDLISSKSVDYSTMMAREGGGGGDDPTSIAAGFGGASSNGFVLMDERERNRRLYHRSRSTENVNDYHHAASAAAAANKQNAGAVVMDPFGLDSDALKRMLQPVRSKSRTSMAAVSPNASPLTSPEMGRRSVGSRSAINDGFQSEPEIGSRTPRFYASLSRVAAGGIGGMAGLAQQQQQHQQQRHMLATGARSMSVSTGPGSYPAGMNRNVQSIGMLPPVQRTRSDALRQNLERNLYMDLDRGGGRDLETGSPSLSDNVLFDSHLCYATTPSSSNGNSDREENNGQLPAVAPPPPAATSPTSRLLLEYEMHLRNTLAKGLDAESCSLHTFEALLSQSMEDLGSIIRANNNQKKDDNTSNGPLAPQRRLLQEVEACVQNRYRNLQYDHPRLGGHKFRNRLGGSGGIGGRNSSSGGAASSAAADVIGLGGGGGGGERERSSRLMRSDTIGSNRSTSNAIAMDVVGGSKSTHRQGQQQQQQLSTSVGADGLERSVYSERDRGYLSDMSSRANSFYDRADSVRSGYLSDRESQRIGSSGFVQQTSIESNDSRLCYLTSSETKRSVRTTSVRMVRPPPVRREEMDF